VSRSRSVAAPGAPQQVGGSGELPIGNLLACKVLSGIHGFKLLIGPPAALRCATWIGTLEQWDAVEPAAVLGENQVHNFYFKEPDSSKWWAGDKDLSAVAWMVVNFGVSDNDSSYRKHVLEWRGGTEPGTATRWYRAALPE